MMPGMLPRVGAAKHPRVFFNTGHGHLGWTLSAATAEIVAGHISNVSEADAAVGRSASTLHVSTNSQKPGTAIPDEDAANQASHPGTKEAGS